jgi:hypothetical protein
MKARKIRRLSSVDAERLTTPELLDEHERVFGPLAPEAKRRMERTASAAGFDRSWEGMDGLAA